MPIGKAKSLYPRLTFEDVANLAKSSDEGRYMKKKQKTIIDDMLQDYKRRKSNRNAKPQSRLSVSNNLMSKYTKSQQGGNLTS